MLYVLLRYEPVVVECEYGRRLTATTGGTLKPAKIRHQSGKKALPNVVRGGDGLYDLFEGAASPVSWSPSPEPHSTTATGGSSMSSGVSSGAGGGLLSPSRVSSGGGGSSVRTPSPMGSSVALAGHHPSSSYSSSSMSGKRSVSGSGDEVAAAGMTKPSPMFQTVLRKKTPSSTCHNYHQSQHNIPSPTSQQQQNQIGIRRSASEIADVGMVAAKPIGGSAVDNTGSMSTLTGTGSISSSAALEIHAASLASAEAKRGHNGSGGGRIGAPGARGKSGSQQSVNSGGVVLVKGGK